MGRRTASDVGLYRANWHALSIERSCCKNQTARIPFAMEMFQTAEYGSGKRKPEMEEQQEKRQYGTHT